jgi:hypothetical protein
VSNSPSVDECFARLRRAGWSAGDIATGSRWLVIGSNGENLIQAKAPSQAEAWWRVCEQARALGMLAGQAGLRCARR